MKKNMRIFLFAAFASIVAFSMKAEAEEPKFETAVKETMAYVNAEVPMDVELIDSGSCGTNVRWAVTTNGILVITSDGNGKMTDYGNFTPWDDYEDCIYSAVVSGKVNHIGSGTFRELYNLLYVYVENGVKTIGGSAFYHCDALEKIELPNSVTSIGRSAFDFCYNLSGINLPSKLKTIPEEMFQCCTSLTSIKIPSGVTEIGNSAFAGCTQLKSVNIPKGVTTINDTVFSNCESLETITIPDTVTYIDREAFHNSGLKTITIPSSVTYIDQEAFSSCQNLKEVSLPENLKEISYRMFAQCTSLETIKIPSSVNYITNNAFNGCMNLKTIRIPAGVKYIEWEVFANCNNLKTISIMNPNVEIDEEVFKDIGREFVIRCIEDSTAQEYAIQNDYKYELIDIGLATEYFDDIYLDWYTAYVQYVYENGLMSGMKDTAEFKPNANITKAQVAQVLYNMEGQPEVTEKEVFTELNDVYEADWYANAVAWAYNTGIVTGDINEKKFFPNANVTREQLALMLFRYAEYKEYDIIADGDLSGLKNDWKVSSWALDGVKWAVGEELISGIENNGVKDLAPQGNATRAQMAAILQRFNENIM